MSTNCRREMETSRKRSSNNVGGLHTLYNMFGVSLQLFGDVVITGKMEIKG